MLVVDDDPAVIYAARALLSHHGCRVEAAFKGLDAVARARAGGLDAVLLDLEMPEVDGLSVLAELRRVTPALKVVLISDAPSAGAREAVARGEALAVLRKPVEFLHALTLISGKVPSAPIPIRLDPTRAAYPTARDALLGKALTLSGEVPLPPGTPVNVLVPHGRQAIVLTGTAARHARHLVVKLLPLTPPARDALTELLQHGAGPRGAARPISRKHAVLRPVPGDRAAQLYARGMLRLEQGKYALALQDLTGARDMGDRPAYAAAVTRAQQLAASDKAQTLVREARAIAGSDPHKALAQLEEAIRLEPARAAAHFEAAHLMLQLDADLERVEERLGAAVHLAPSDPAPRVQFAQLLERAGRVLEAHWAATAALALFPGDADVKQLAARLERKLSAVPVGVQSKRMG